MTWSDLLWLSLFSMLSTFCGMAIGGAILFVLSLINDRISEDRQRQRERWDVRDN